MKQKEKKENVFCFEEFIYKKRERFAFLIHCLFLCFFLNNDRLIEQEEERKKNTHTQHHVEGSASSEGFDSVGSSGFALVSVGSSV